MRRRIYQINEGLAYGGAIGNYIILIDKLLKRHGISTDIYVNAMDKRYPPATAKYYRDFPADVSSDDVILYHMCHETPLNREIARLKCKKIMIYHNITPSAFLARYSPEEAARLERGRQDLVRMEPFIDGCLAVSKYNADDLIRHGYSGSKIEILRGCFVPFSMYQEDANRTILERYHDDIINVLFVGRIAPNKKYEDIIRQFAFYQKHFNPNSRLFLVGNETYPAYADKLRAYNRQIGAKNVIFTGHTSFDELVAYYKIADVFLCMSEHEGFCVPLIEAMYFNIPVIAYASSAVPDTLGQGGVLLETKDPAIVAGWIDRITTHSELRNTILENGKNRLDFFSLSRMEDDFLEKLEKILNQSLYEQKITNVL